MTFVGKVEHLGANDNLSSLKYRKGRAGEREGREGREGEGPIQYSPGCLAFLTRGH